jgi:hypothetical protein
MPWNPLARWVAVAVSLLLSGCGPTRSEATDGTYKAAASSPIGGASLVLETAAKTATVTLPSGGTPVMMQLTALPQAQWERGCPTNYTSVLVETFTLSPDPLVLGTVTLTAPRLTAGCGLDAANPDEVRLSGTSGDSQVFINFSRVTN